MAVDLITAKRGVPHVSPRNDATIYRALIGKESGYFEYGDGCAPEVVSGQRKVKINSGIGMVQGRMFMVTPEIIDVPAWTGRIRSDNIYIRVTCDTETDTQTGEIVYMQDGMMPPRGDLDSNETSYLLLATVSLYNATQVSVTDLRTIIFSTQEAYENARYTKYIDVSYSFTSSTGDESFNHNIPTTPADMWDYTYDIVDMYAVSSDGQTRYQLPYIYGGTSPKYISVQVTSTQIRVSKNSSWSGYTLHVIVGKKVH